MVSEFPGKLKLVLEILPNPEPQAGAAPWGLMLGAVLSAPIGSVLRPPVLCLWAGLILRASTACPVAEASTFMASPAPRVLTQSH